jgi:hypothetical protein
MLAAITSFAVCFCCLLMFFGERGNDCGGGCGVHGCCLLGLLLLPLPLNWQRHVTYMPNATWRRRGVATARGGGSPTLETKRSVSGKGKGLHKRSAEAWGHPFRARGAELPLGAFAFVVVFQKIRAGEKCRL